MTRVCGQGCDALGTCRAWGRAAAAVVAVALCPVASLAEPLTFATNFPRADGTSRAISFSGDLTREDVDGRLSVDGQEVDVVAELAGGRVTGQFRSSGSGVGTFKAEVIGRELHGRHDLNGEVGAWTIPLSEIPREARDLLESAKSD